MMVLVRCFHPTSDLATWSRLRLRACQLRSGHGAPLMDADVPADDSIILLDRMKIMLFVFY
jgi:hypothetical protein